MSRLIYSDSLCEMVESGFSITAVLFGDNGYKVCKSIHYTWNDEDCVYYNDDVDGDFYMEIPKLTGKFLCKRKDFNYKRYMVKLDN